MKIESLGHSTRGRCSIQRIGLGCVCAIGLVAAGCAPQFAEPLPVPTATVDPSHYVGSWKLAEAAGEAATGATAELTITTGVGDALDGEYRDASATTSVTIYLAAAGAKTIVSIGLPNEERWGIAQTSLQDNGQKLAVRFIDNDALRQAIDDGELDGAVLHRGERGRFLESEGEPLVVSSTGAAVLEWLQEHPSAVGVDEPVVFKRTSPVSALQEQTRGKGAATSAAADGDTVPVAAKAVLSALVVGFLAAACALVWRDRSLARWCVSCKAVIDLLLDVRPG